MVVRGTIMLVDKFIDLASKAIGDTNVITYPKELEKYSRDHSLVKPGIPSCIVRPGSVEEVQEIIEYANKLLVPITPLSGGTNNLGGTIPVPNGVILDLKRMNRVLDIDVRAGMASIQPGVTFEQLQEYASKHGLRALTPVELPKTSSALSTYLDLAPLYGWVYYGEEILTTMTVLLPDGTLLKTGQQAFPQIKWPYVHSHASPFAGLMNYIWYQSQGTLGVVAQGWVKLKPIHEVVEAFFVTVNDDNDLYKIAREIMWMRYPRDMVIFNNVDAALFFEDETPNYGKKTAELIPSLPKWVVAFTLRGRKEGVDIMVSDIAEKLQGIGYKLLDEVPGMPKAKEIFLSEVNYPSGWPKYSKYRGARTILPFICSLKDVPIIHQALKKFIEKHGFSTNYVGVTITPTDRVGVVACNVAFNREIQEVDKIRNLYYEVAEEMLRLGAFYSRPYGILAKLMYSRAQNYYEVLMKIKRTLDPNNIMNPRRLTLTEDL
ncbi:MAG: FAD-binding oxidoreductase [Ignisphaera sp.]|uniref:FAD-binding oxidoreductase n=1 Tax=Ignisphaera aggregans TaxID=334771 RepID=A0A7C4JKF7_9CREN